MEFEFFRKDKLVFAGVLKCASTYYTNLVLHNQWKKIQFVDIDWNKDHVFGFIMDPIERYIKGLAEDVADPMTVWNIDYLPVHKDCITFTFHSLPISLVLKDRMYLVDWILLDSEVQSDIMFTKLLKKYNLDFDWPVDINKHQSTKEKIVIANKISDALDRDNFVFRQGLSADLTFYKTVLSQTNIWGETWDEISWLRN